MSAFENGYTIVPDQLVKEFGYLTALVYGVVNRYSKLKRGRCDASLSTVGKQIGITRQAVTDHIKKLCDAGYLEKNETGNGATNYYYVTGKLSQGYKPVNESDTPPVNEGYRVEDNATLPVNESYTPCNPSLQGGVNEDYTSSSSSSSISVESSDELSNTQTILKNPKQFSVEDIQQAKFTTSQYKQLLELEKKSDKPRKTLLRYIRKKLTPKPLAVEAYRSVARVYPEKGLWEDIGKTVGDDPDKIEFWTNVVKTYIGLGWNKMNIINMLDYFKRGELPSMNGKNTNGHQPTKATVTKDGGLWI